MTLLLERNPEKRLGCKNSDADDIKSHPFFRQINWTDLNDKKIKPPYKPFVTGAEDTRNIDALFTNEKLSETPDGVMTYSVKQKTKFKGFTYNQEDILKKQ